MMRTPRVRPAQESDRCEMMAAVIDRLNRENADLLEEIRQLRAAVAIYRRIVEQATAAAVEHPKVDAA